MQSLVKILHWCQIKTGYEQCICFVMVSIRIPTSCQSASFGIGMSGSTTATGFGGAGKACLKISGYEGSVLKGKHVSRSCTGVCDRDCFSTLLLSRVVKDLIRRSTGSFVLEVLIDL